MSDLNLCSFIGRLGRDPETKYTAGGNAVTQISIACGWKTKEAEGTEWIPVVFFGRLAEVAGEYLRKGSQVYVQGRFRTQKWEQDGQTRYRSEIVATQMQMLGSKHSSGGDSPVENHGRSYAEASGRSSRRFDDDEDLPF